MERAIVGFHRDEESHWVAELACGHRQHTRHIPPLSNRPWVESEAGRAAHLGTRLDCVRCDRREVPEAWEEYRRTPRFDERSVPAALLERHTTKAGVWALIHVSAGRLRYRIHEPYDEERVVEAGERAVVLPEVEHEVEPLGPVEFQVAFLRAPAPGR